MTYKRFTFEKLYRSEYGVFEEGFIDHETGEEYGYDDDTFNERMLTLLNQLDADRQTYLTMAVRLAKKLGFTSPEEFHDKVKEGYLD